MRRVFAAITVIGFLAIAAFAQENEVPLVLPHRSGPGLSRPLSSGGSVTVPAETQVSIQMLSGIHTQVNHTDDLGTSHSPPAAFSTDVSP